MPFFLEWLAAGGTLKADFLYAFRFADVPLQDVPPLWPHDTVAKIKSLYLYEFDWNWRDHLCLFAVSALGFDNGRFSANLPTNLSQFQKVILQAAQFWIWNWNSTVHRITSLHFLFALEWREMLARQWALAIQMWPLVWAIVSQNAVWSYQVVCYIRMASKCAFNCNTNCQQQTTHWTMPHFASKRDGKPRLRSSCHSQYEAWKYVI